MSSDVDGFNFDEWMALAEHDSEAFERRRAQWLERAIQLAPDHQRHRLAGLQCRIDLIRRKSRHPLGACIKLSSMMLDSLLGEMPSVATVNAAEQAPQASADIVLFNPGAKAVRRNSFRRNGGDA